MKSNNKTLQFKLANKNGDNLTTQYNNSQYNIRTKINKSQTAYDQQQTTRIYEAEQINIKENLDDDQTNSQQNSSETDSNQFEAINQYNNLRKQALDKASFYIDILTDQNTTLRRQVNQLNNEIEEVKGQYQKKLEKAHQIIKNLQQKSTSYSDKKQMTPIKITANQSPVKSRVFRQQQNVLPMLAEALFLEQINQFHHEREELQQLISIEKAQIDEIKQQNMNIIQIIEEQFIFKKLDLNSYVLQEKLFRNQNNKNRNSGYSLISIMSHQYQQIIRKWTNYANSIKVCLFQCIDLMKNANDIDLKERYQNYNNYFNDNLTELQGTIEYQYIDESLIRVIVRDIIKAIDNSNKELIAENRELKKLMDQLINKIQRNCHQ